VEIALLFIDFHRVQVYFELDWDENREDYITLQAE
jgi:hypothetical protein